jgi:4-amino-4-deoxy-L-arabinose transferase-like glycosyltransferase
MKASSRLDHREKELPVRSIAARAARLIAAAVLSFLLISGVIHSLAVSLGRSRQSVALLGVIWLMPLAIVILLLVLNRTGRTVIVRIAESRANLAVSTLAALCFLFTLVPFKTSSRWMVTYLAMASTAFILLLAVACPVLDRFRAFLRPAWRFLSYRLRPATFLLLTSGAVLTVTNLISWRVFQHFPHVIDSIVQVFQGHIFASGRITLPVRFDDYFFGFPYVINDGTRMYAQYPFGHSLLLALGTLVHAEWLINPLLGSAEIIVLYFLGKEAYDETTGRIAALLGVASPFLLFMSSEYMNHASGLLFLSLFLLFFLRTIRPLRGTHLSSSFSDPLLSGLSLAMALNIRPLSALAVSIPAACYGVYLLFKSRWKTLPSFLVLLAPALLGLGAFFLYNYMTTGNPLLSGYKAYGMLEYGHTRWGLGFGERGIDGWGAHTPLRGLSQTGDNLSALNLYLFEGALPGLLGVLLLFLTSSRNQVDWLLLASFVALPVLYSFYWYQDLIFGPRFLYEGLAPILLLSARGLAEFPRFIGRVAGADAETRTRNVIAMGATFSLAVTAVFGLPRLVTMHGYRYLGVDNRVRARVIERGISNAVVFVGTTHTFYFGAGLLNNTLDMNGPVVYARDRGVENYVLMRRFPGRAYYYADPWAFFQITDINSLPNAPEMRDLEQAGRFVREHGTSGYCSVLLPYREAGAFVDTGSTPCRTFRELSYELLRGTGKAGDFLPAIAVFRPGDTRRYLPLLERMRERRDYVSDCCRFTLLFSADSGTAVVYRIRSAGGSSDTAP